MKRIWIAGGSGSGKTTLANLLGRSLNISVFHRDSITWDENDNIRSEDEQILLVKEATDRDKWIFEGARFTASKIDGRLDRCDTIIHLSTNRFICLYRVFKRSYVNSKDKSVPELQKQPVSFEIIKYILLDYPRKAYLRRQIFIEAKQRGISVIFLSSQTQVNIFLKNFKYE